MRRPILTLTLNNNQEDVNKEELSNFDNEVEEQ